MYIPSLLDFLPIQVTRVHAQSLSHVWIFATLQTVARQAPLSMGLPQARILEWVAISSSRGPSQPWDQTHISCVSCIAVRLFTTEPSGKSNYIMDNSQTMASEYVKELISSFFHLA